MKNDTKPTLSPSTMQANADYYQALADKAKLSHIEYLRSRDVWLKMLHEYNQSNKIAQ